MNSLSIASSATRLSSMLPKSSSAGKTKISLVVHIVSSLVNVTFNYLLIEGHLGFPRLEIFGAALASTFGLFASAVVAIRPSD